MTPILVTGGAKGLGAEICYQLASKGHDIVIHFRQSEKEAHVVAKKCRQKNVAVETIKGDFSSNESLESFIDSYRHHFPKTKGIVNNVGNYIIAPSLNTEPEQWLSLFQTNFFAPVFLIRSLISSLKHNQGSVVNVGIAGLRCGKAMTQATAYSTTKSALWFYTVSLAKELASSFVRVNMVSPGYLETAIDLEDPAKLPLKRPAYLHEVACVIASLFDKESEYITGQNIEVAGGIGL